ncbi:stage V sporulation protein B [Thermoclostridium stercorarium subsp. stercorarium DSM 8532]|jgi:stage V sporulation protein B|uniref:Stage V sporulation protein B n=2 Tax=Thermoclostridium stercorarium TaxID=1510 RepID=L7VKQ3_THES1|nr:polysaccharide biosynthesis protein [Thermoclostridium stercorarium]AGC67061.1 stage V sporulation protein B [Thermoclostridium stercorarium subsp. stercorarium DSM 8532]AGI38147.1 membrane protein [Thermoclostridium stercorarium subsp. stercorarium DSM 8532]ANW97554.1 stage V sporulation protein B [Thermoclostridium stercorarium subsp. thermolacticum DSM 2910]
MRKKSLKQNTFILTVAGFVVKLLGFFYRIFVANSIGAEGMGLFQLVLPVYNFILLGLTAGLGIAISRLVAEETALGNHRNAKRITVVSGVAVFIAGTVIVSVLLLNLDFVVDVFVGDVRTKSAIYYLLPTIPFIAALSTLKGYFYGRQEVIPNAVSQVAEQVTKLVVVYLIAGFFINGDLEQKCLFATIGLITGEIANVLTVFIAYKFRKSDKHTPRQRIMRKRDIAVALLRISLPITANRLVLSLLGTVEFLWIPQRLSVYGMTHEEALTQYGKLTGMASPVISFPSMLTAALATALVPAIAEAVATRRMNIANRQISRSVRVTLVLGFLFTSLFICFAYEISDLIYPGQNVGHMLYLLSFTAVFFYLQQTLLGILNGLGKETATLKHSMITSLIRLGFVWFGIPYLGLNAYIASLIVSNFAGAMLNMRTVIKTTGMSLEIGDWIIKPLVASISGIIAAPVIKMAVSSVLNSQLLILLVSAGICGGMMIAMLIFMGVFEIRDMRHMIPFNIDKYRKL